MPHSASFCEHQPWWLTYLPQTCRTLSHQRVLALLFSLPLRSSLWCGSQFKRHLLRESFLITLLYHISLFQSDCYNAMPDNSVKVCDKWSQGMINETDDIWEDTLKSLQGGEIICNFTYMAQDLSPEYVRNSQNSTVRKQTTLFFKRQKILSGASSKKIYWWQISIGKNAQHH